MPTVFSYYPDGDGVKWDSALTLSSSGGLKRANEWFQKITMKIEKGTYKNNPYHPGISKKVPWRKWSFRCWTQVLAERMKTCKWYQLVNLWRFEWLIKCSNVGNNLNKTGQNPFPQRVFLLNQREINVKVQYHLWNINTPWKYVYSVLMKAGLLFISIIFSIVYILLDELQVGIYPTTAQM